MPRFLKQMRMLKKRDFLQLKSSPDTQTRLGKYLILHILNNPCKPSSSLGIIVTKRYGDAWQRNRFKRLIRETFRLNYSHIPSSIQLIAKPKGKYRELSQQDIESDFLTVVSSI